MEDWKTKLAELRQQLPKKKVETQKPKVETVEKEEAVEPPSETPATVLADARSRSPYKPKMGYSTPQWVADYKRKYASHGEVKHILRTTDVYEASGRLIEKDRTERLLPVIVPPPKMPPPIEWQTRPTHDGVAPRMLSPQEKKRWLDENPGQLIPLGKQLEGPTRPVRKQMARLNKVWRYRNFQACRHCSEFDERGKVVPGKGTYDTWEARTDPSESPVGAVHSLIWCHSCGATDREVAKELPANVGVWSPPKESDKEIAEKEARRKYREERALFFLVQSPKTVPELTRCFREVDKYKAVDFVMIEIMLRRMERQGRVVLSEGRWWDGEDYLFEHPEA